MAISSRVSVAVICHNYGRFLDDCLKSLAAQTQVLYEVFVVDDSSTDETPAVCQRRGMKVVKGHWRNVFLAREAAFQHATGDVICFLDADDMLQPDYIATGCQHFADPNVGVVYSDCQYFGDQTGRTNFREDFDREDLWRENYIHAGSLVRRDALRAMRAFEPTTGVVNTHADWTLWKRVLRSNGGWTAVKQAGLYHYRKHGSNMLRTMKSFSYYERADLQHEPITIFCPLSGRLDLWQRFSQQLAQLKWPRSLASLVLYDTSQQPYFSARVAGWVNGCGFDDVRHVRAAVGTPSVADADRRNSPSIVAEVRQAVARIYNWMRDNVSTHYVMVFEDDVFPKDDNIVERLLRGFDIGVDSVSAAYRSAYGPAFVAWSKTFPDGRPVYSEVADDGLRPTIGNGFGCVILRRTMFADRFVDQEHAASGTRSSDYDIEFYTRHSAIRPESCRINWDIEVEHISRRDT